MCRADRQGMQRIQAAVRWVCMGWGMARATIMAALASAVAALALVAEGLLALE